MTHNQIEYWKLQEEMRASRAKEAENLRHNYATEVQQQADLAESARHSKAVEGENRRHNVQSEYISGRTLDENIRHNVATEGETVRSNMEHESISRTNVDVDRERVAASLASAGMQQSVGLANVALGWANLDELNRHQGVTENISERSLNLDTEKLYEQERSNKAREKETRRHNIVTEITNGVGTASNVAGGVIRNIVLPFVK